jgi:hypothetical protein
MPNKADLLEALDVVEKQLGTIIAEATAMYVTDNGVEPMAIYQARTSYGTAGLWLRHWINSDTV